MATHTPASPGEELQHGWVGTEGMLFCAVLSFKSKQAKKKKKALHDLF